MPLVTGYSLITVPEVAPLQPELQAGAGAVGAAHGSPQVGLLDLHEKKLRPVEPQPATTTIKRGMSLRTELSPR